MTQIYIIAGIITVVSMLICYIFIRQTIVKKQKERARLHKALEKRVAHLVQMLNSFPPHFLPKDLTIFLHRCIVDTYEQLSKLLPDEPEYLDNFKLYTAQMETFIRSANDKSNAITFQNTNQINEIRQNLNLLGRFLQTWAKRGNLSQKQYGTYKEQVKKLVIQLMVDNYILSAKQARQMEKEKLSMHYYMLAKNLITKEGLVSGRKQRLEAIDEELSHLQQAIAAKAISESGMTSTTSSTEDSDDNKAWGQFQEDADWKKKNIYD